MLGLFFVGDYEVVKTIYYYILDQFGYYKYLYNPSCVRFGCNFLHDFPGILLIFISFILIFFAWAVVAKKKNLFKASVKMYLLMVMNNFLGKEIPKKYIDQMGNTESNIDEEGFDRGISCEEKKAARQKSKWFSYGLLFFYFFLAFFFLAIPLIVLIKR